MRIITITLLALLLVNCGNKKFTSDSVQPSIDLLEDEFIIDDDGETIADDDTTDDDDGDDDDDDTTDPYCPRYDLVVKSSHISTKRLTYKFIFNAEVNQFSNEGQINVQFLEDGAKKFTECSGEYTNTAHYLTLKPLKAIEQLTREIMLDYSKSCAAVMPERLTSIQVIDSANGNILWDEQKLKNRFGDCAFGYTDEGTEIRNSIIGFSDKVTKEMANQCTAI